SLTNGGHLTPCALPRPWRSLAASSCSSCGKCAHALKQEHWSGSKTSSQSSAGIRRDEMATSLQICRLQEGIAAIIARLDPPKGPPYGVRLRFDGEGGEGYFARSPADHPDHPEHVAPDRTIALTFFDIERQPGGS